MIYKKINNFQIKCILEEEDFASRNININDLRYGSKQTENLFMEIITDAHKKFGFNENNLPVSIEAIPLINNRLEIILTVVDEPEELDSRFSRFTPDPATTSNDFFTKNAHSDNIDDLFNFFNKINNTNLKSDTANPKPDNSIFSYEKYISSFTDEIYSVKNNTSDHIIFKFDSIDKIIGLSDFLNDFNSDYTSNTVNFMDVVNSLYKNNNDFYLICDRSFYNTDDFVNWCNIVCEYGTPVSSKGLTEEYIIEHSELLLKENALQQLSRL